MLVSQGSSQPVLADALFYMALPKAILFRQLLLRDSQLKVLLRQSKQVKTTVWERFQIVMLIRGFPSWKDHVSIVAASTVRDWMNQFPKELWSLRTWLGIVKSQLLRRMGLKKVRVSAAREEILSLMRSILAIDGRRGVDRIHGELLKLGIRVSRARVARYLQRYFPRKGRPVKDPITPKQLLTSMKNAWASDFFVKLTFFGKALYFFFIIDQDRRKLVHGAVTFRPSGLWVVQQVKRAFERHGMPKYFITDNDPAFKYTLAYFLKREGVKHLRIAYRSPWQNGVAERWVGTARRELFDLVPIFSSRQAERLLESYVEYYNVHRPHLFLDGDSPEGRPVTPRPSKDAKLVAHSLCRWPGPFVCLSTGGVR